MPYRRYKKTYGRRRFKKSYGRKWFGKFKRWGSRRTKSKHPVHMYKRALNGVYDGGSVISTISVSGTGGDYFACPQFKLNDLPGVSELISLYDQYKINAVKFELIPQSNVNSFVGETVPYIHSVMDFDDSTNLANLNEAYEYESLKSTSAFRKHVRYLRPRFLVTGINTAGATVPINLGKGWLSTSQTSIVHRGLKLIIEDSTSASVDLILRIKTTFYVSFKNVK